MATFRSVSTTDPGSGALDEFHGSAEAADGEKILASWVHMGVEPKIGGKPPKWMVKIMENPIKHGMIWG